MRSKLIKILTFLGGIYFFLRFVLPETLPGGIKFSYYNDQISVGVLTISAMAIGLGLINLLLGHGAAIAYLRKGWINSAALLFGLFAMLVVSGSDWYLELKIAQESQRLLQLRDFAGLLAEQAVPLQEAVPLQQAVPPQEAVAPEQGHRVLALRKAAQAELALLREEISASARLRSELATEQVERQQRALAELEKGSTQLAQGEQSLSAQPTSQELQDFGLLLANLGVAKREYLLLKHEQSLSKKLYRFLYSGIFVALGSAMFSLLGFYIASAAYRSFRVRSMESGLMMLAALVVIIGQVPFMIFGTSPLGVWLFEAFPRARLWLLTVPNSAAFRAIELGAGIAGLVMAFRMWLSIESESFSEKRDAAGRERSKT